MKWLSRRAVLRGAGAAVALPFLEIMRPRRARADEPDVPPAPPARRFVGLFVPNGIHMPDWTPAATGSDFELSPILNPLLPFQEKLLVLSGLSNFGAKASVPGDHARGTGSFLTCMPVKKTEGENIQNGVSIDQRLAQEIGQWTTFPSLELGAEGGSSIGDCDSGYSCAYTRNISWSGPATPVPKEVSPQEVFDRLFGGFDLSLTLKQVERRRLLRLSVLDFVTADAQALKLKLGQADRNKLEEYLDGVRELEKRIEKETDAPACYPGPTPALALDPPTHVMLMMDLLALAFQCDLTRVATFMFGNGGSGRVHSHLGLTDGHHYLSHHAGDPAKHVALAQIATWEVSMMAYLVEKLDGIQEADGTALDNSIVFLSSDIEDGNTHQHTNLPVVVAGSGGGAFETGKHLTYADNEPLANLFVSTLNALDVPDQTFGMDGTKPLSGLTG
ncbi:MAG: hypothetical protein ACI9WU_002802 [Myxococcota bacterium]|jgi:hypothetical protein